MFDRKGYLALVLLIVFNALFIVPESSADSRGLNVTSRDSSASSGGSFYDNSWAVIIGIDKYQKWPKLEYAVHDAKGMKEVLKKLGFTKFLELCDLLILTHCCRSRLCRLLVRCRCLLCLQIGDLLVLSLFSG